MDTAPLNQDGEDNGKEEETTSPTTTIPSFPGTTTTSDDPPPPFPFPFPPTSHILLLGEGDLSLSTTLHKTHHCTNLLPTVLDTQPELFTKYHPQASAHVAHLAAHNIHPLYSIDATKLHLAPRIRKYPGGGFDAVVFMFPHVGGKTSDQARQVRANQQMLLGMFASVKGVVKKAAKGEKGGVLAVALFDGEPYHTWDIRALARAHGWRVQRSGKLDWEAFKGYKHARTLGNIERGGWKGEERPAKLWIFEKDDGKKLNAPGKKKKKRKGNDPDGSSSSESDSEGERAAIAKRRKQGMAALKAQVRT
ncbi:hypothetical protein DFH27DRAFT_479964 [Peziza echinospora]|nr:hypothetical protein DFH27DRAFT_479964 [Peziza echinospora]